MGRPEGREATGSAARISVVIPTLREAGEIEDCLDHVRRLGFDEVIVVDGGSDDDTVERARSRADRVEVETGGLARQLNAGASLASGEVLLFLYADTRLPPTARELLADTFGPSRAPVGGAFQLGFESTSRGFRVIACGGNWRNRLGLGPFGDQAIFATREAFEAAGGYDPGAFLEDLDLVRRLRRLGEFRLLPLEVKTSVRRWEARGFYRTLAIHWAMTALYLLGKRRRGRAAGKVSDHLRRQRQSAPPERDSVD